MKASFSLLGKQLPHAKISIPVGFRFSGAINIFGLQASVDIITSPTRFKVSAQLPLLNILGILKMYKSQNEKSKGPYLHVDISATKLPLIDISGFVEVLGISVEEVFVEGKFLVKQVFIILL